MFEISKSNQFKRDFKLIQKRNYNIEKLESILDLLIIGELLPSKYKEHLLKGKYKNCYECHIEPD